MLPSKHQECASRCDLTAFFLTRFLGQRTGDHPGSSPGRLSLENALSQIATKALDALAGFLEIAVFRGIGNPERRSEPERRTLHHRDAFGLQQLGDEILVVADHLARWRSLAHGAGAGRVDIERALRPR